MRQQRYKMRHVPRWLLEELENEVHECNAVEFYETEAIHDPDPMLFYVGPDGRQVLAHKPEELCVFPVYGYRLSVSDAVRVAIRTLAWKDAMQAMGVFCTQEGDVSLFGAANYSVSRFEKVFLGSYSTEKIDEGAQQTISYRGGVCLTQAFPVGMDVTTLVDWAFLFGFRLLQLGLKRRREDSLLLSFTEKEAQQMAEALEPMVLLEEPPALSSDEEVCRDCAFEHAWIMQPERNYIWPGPYAGLPAVNTSAARQKLDGLPVRQKPSRIRLTI